MKKYTELNELELLLLDIAHTDKTKDYSYNPNNENCKNRSGYIPRHGGRFATPFEIVQHYFGSNFSELCNMYSTNKIIAGNWRDPDKRGKR